MRAQKYHQTIDKLWSTYDVDKNNYVDEKEAVGMMVTAAGSDPIDIVESTACWLR